MGPLPTAAELREIFAAAREHGVTHFRCGGLEVRLSPPTVPAPAFMDGAKLVAAVNDASPLPPGDLEDIRRQLGITTKLVGGGTGAAGDVLDHMARGGRLTVNDEPDPTRPQTPTV